jgi:hypothetical protein
MCALDHRDRGAMSMLTSAFSHVGKPLQDAPAVRPALFLQPNRLNPLLKATHEHIPLHRVAGGLDIGQRGDTKVQHLARRIRLQILSRLEVIGLSAGLP